MFWLDEAKRQALGDAVGAVVAERHYTVWTCAVLANHVHMVIRRHRDDALTMWRDVANGAALALRDFSSIGASHPVWAARPYKVFLRTPDEVRGRVVYVERNPKKERLSRQQFAFVHPYDNWPFHKPR